MYHQEEHLEEHLTEITIMLVKNKGHTNITFKLSVEGFTESLGRI